MPTTIKMMAFDAARGVLPDVKPCMIERIGRSCRACELLLVGSIAHSNE
jgi:hypothetical protein